MASYAAAQLVSAGKALQSVLAWDYEMGAYLSALIILLYCFAGGIRASIWTDIAQAIVMLVGMYCLVFFSVQEAGGLFSLNKKLMAIDPNLTIFLRILFSILFF